MIAAGCLSGTSLDGIDVAVVDLRPRGDGYDVRVERFETLPFVPTLRTALVGALPPHRGSTESVAALHATVGAAFGAAVATVAAGRRLDYVASHGITLWHDPGRRFTFQIGDPFRIRERCNATVIADFRSADTAAGGSGAPLVPAVDYLLFADAHEDRVAVNLGGIANLSILRAGGSMDDVIAFDSGPANMLLDLVMAERTGGRETFDRDGAHALRGRVDAALLEAMREDDYFGLPAPKSTGRERFGAGFLARYARDLSRLTLDDACATLAALTATTLADAILGEGVGEARIIVSGGGAHNRAILEGLARALPHATFGTSDGYGISPDAKEAVAFAVLGYETLRRRPGAIARVTGARRPTILGAIVPYEFDMLTARVHEEVAAAAVKMPG